MWLAAGEIRKMAGDGKETEGTGKREKAIKRYIPKRNVQKEIRKN